MKKSLIALAVIAVSGTAFAQSTVTLSGTYSVSYQKDLTSTVGNSSYAPSTAGAATNTTNSVAAVGQGFAVTDAALKLAAVEDLGGGLKASFDYTLETGAQRGAAATRADSGIALSGGFGSIAVRNTRSGDLIASIGSSAVSLPDGIYDSSNIVARAAGDLVTYTLPAFSGVTASVTYFEGNDGNLSLPATNKSATVLGLSYSAGPLAAAAAFKSTNSPAVGTKSSNQEFMVSYDLGVAKVAVAFDGKSADTGTYSEDATGFSVTVPMGAITLGANSFKRGTNKVNEFGVNYALSKRTSVNLASGKQSADNNGNQNRIMLKHTF